MIIDTAITIPEHRLHARLAAGLRQAQRAGRPVLVSTVLRAPQCDPLDFFAHGASLADERFFWSNPGAEYAIAGVEAAWTLGLAGARRFADAASAWRVLCEEALIDDPFGVPGTGPLLIGGFSFDPLRPATLLWEGYPDGLLVLPRYVLTAADGAAWLTLNTVIEPESSLDAEVEHVARIYDLFDGDPLAKMLAPMGGIRRSEDVMPAEQWKAIVAQVEQNLRRGELGKVVLARQVQVEGRAPFDPAVVLDRLRADYADCFVFAVARGDRCFLGASPERLVRLRDGVVRATCLAGSIARGATPEQDQRLGAELMASAKDRAEHEFVVRAIIDALADVCGEQLPNRKPSLMKLRNVQHLFTPIVGRVAVGCDILDVVSRLHPTPAMGGVPREPALEMIRRFEGMARGWYAAPVGWMDARGEGEFAVAIRSALLRGAEASLFAGCGIVAGSDPDREYAESCLKLRPMLAALGGE
ncbi:MAG TPA: isochorismate synthase [Roseiflexaceae bacterium]|nr:isochorismate synthase [Roseiflexaceae bacterium]